MAATDAGQLYIGLISGTSADAIDAALVALAPAPHLLHALSLPYPPRIREQLLDLIHDEDATVALDELGALDVEIGHAFAHAARTLLLQAGVDATRVRAIGSHGQTVRHRPRQDVPFTLQLGDPNVIAEGTGIATVADFRRRDVAAGGEGAPLVPAFHAAVLASDREARVVLNLGGIANVTLLPPRGDVAGFDTGPANALLDGWTQRHRGAAHDAGGAWAATGRCDHVLLDRLLADHYFARRPPKSTGREEFSLTWLDLALHAHRGLEAADVAATLVELTARSVAQAVRATLPGAARVIACGGGVHNAYLMQRLASALGATPLESSTAHGIDPDFCEAMAFAWLAQRTLAGLPGNLVHVTGAAGPRVLGAVWPGK
jgi:anhydro-N-acetylmuramic acid kinase